MKSGDDRDSMPSALGLCRMIDRRADPHYGSQSLEGTAQREGLCSV